MPDCRQPAAPVNSPTVDRRCHGFFRKWIANPKEIKNMKSPRGFVFYFAIFSLVGGQGLLTTHDRIALAKPTAPAKRLSPQAQEDLPKIILLNQSAVLIASKKNRDKYREHQDRLIGLMSKGVTVLICPDCMKRYGVKAADLVDGVQIGKLGQTHES
jgi:hypothetical protein